jgi:hypothetical protein
MTALGMDCWTSGADYDWWIGHTVRAKVPDWLNLREFVRRQGKTAGCFIGQVPL